MADIPDCILPLLYFFVKIFRVLQFLLYLLFFLLKDGVVKYSGEESIFKEEVIRDVFDIQVRILAVEDKKIILH